jgi:hypothetical protein
VISSVRRVFARDGAWNTNAIQSVALNKSNFLSMTVGASTSKAVPETGSKRNDPANQPWIEKYRPQTLDDVAANKEIVGTIKRLTDENRLPHLLLYGPPGVFQCQDVPCRVRNILQKRSSSAEVSC